MLHHSSAGVGDGDLFFLAPTETTAGQNQIKILAGLKNDLILLNYIFFCLNSSPIIVLQARCLCFFDYTLVIGPWRPLQVCVGVFVWPLPVGRYETWACIPFTLLHPTSHVKETLLLRTGNKGSAILRSSGLVDLRSRNTGDALTHLGAQSGTQSLWKQKVWENIYSFFFSIWNQNHKLSHSFVFSSGLGCILKSKKRKKVPHDKMMRVHKSAKALISK